ncbi:MAG: glycerol-3-phosphate dehydrogenase/oxidase, partial [Steroidobacteraceae bacterium]
MHRHPSALVGREFDVLVIGGGAAGAAAAREATLRGLSVALIEREDFGSGTSAQCFKVVHGGIRYLQHLDVGRLRASCRERSILLAIAPHLVAPLPFAIPTYGRGRSGRTLLELGMRAYDALTLDRNRHIPDRSRHIRRTRFLGREQILAHFPLLERHGLSGAAVFEDGQMYNPPRLVLAFIAAAAENGALVANYIEAERLLHKGSHVFGVLARDRLSGNPLEIHARVTLNAGGPWAEGLLHGLGKPLPPATYSRDACFIIGREPAAAMALAVQGRTRDGDALLARAARHLFLVPWRGRTLVGVWHTVVARDPDRVGLAPEELAGFIAEINAAFPALALERSEVRRACFGLVPFGEASRQHPGALSFGKQSRITDHREQGLTGLVSAVSVRYTVARSDAVQALDLACRQLGHRVARCGSATHPLPGGDIEDFPRFERELAARAADSLASIPEGVHAALARNHGSRAVKVLGLAAADPPLRRCIPGTHVLGAEIVYAVREEMAQTLNDVLFRRTELATDGHPGLAALQETESLLRRECGWSAHRALEE